jgi:inner membrane protein
MLTLWWVWVVAGFLIGMVEIVVPGYIFLGFAIGAVLTGALIGLGIAGASVPALLLIFALISLAAWFALRAVFGVRKGQVKRWTTDINDN